MYGKSRRMSLLPFAFVASEMLANIPLAWSLSQYMVRFQSVDDVTILIALMTALTPAAVGQFVPSDTLARVLSLSVAPLMYRIFELATSDKVRAPATVSVSVRLLLPSLDTLVPAAEIFTDRKVGDDPVAMS